MPKKEKEEAKKYSMKKVTVNRMRKGKNKEENREIPRGERI